MTALRESLPNWHIPTVGVRAILATLFVMAGWWKVLGEGVFPEDRAQNGRR